MNIELVPERLERLENDRTIQNFIAQANARYILLSTSEERGNFPAYTFQDERMNVLALYYLTLGCSFAEGKDLESARAPLEKGASILEYINGAQIGLKENSNFYSLVSALAYYVGFQYSKAYVLIQKVQTSTLIGRLIQLFLQREFGQLSLQVNQLFVDPLYSDSALLELSEEEGGLRVAEYVIARSLDCFVKYFYSGEENFLTRARNDLNALKDITELKNEPALWWVIRLLLLVEDGFSVASVWNVLYKHLGKSFETDLYIRSLIYNSPRGIFELFVTQRKSLEQVLSSDGRGCVVSIPTSSGKTRIAEIAILDCLLKNPSGKVLYIAPFKSLAFEVENSLERILSNSGIPVSHLYGGSLYNSLDELSLENSRVIISTPEKAKAILRSNYDFIEQIALIVIDEGHLIGAEPRYIMNEIFYEELRFFAEKNNGRFLLLSAVLPNPEDLAIWLTGDENTTYKDNWRPSDERLGILEWTGEHVNLNWESSDTKERASFNKRFIVQEELPKIGRQRKTRYFPSDSNDAVVATALKLRSFGPVLIFVGRKDSVFVLAKAYLQGLEQGTADFIWRNDTDWRAFELASIEAYGNDNRWLSYARKGILCHHADLQTDVRLPLERLMRTEKPHAIISTSTLGQGVNLGVSSVIFASVHQGREDISVRDFWNIAGRAGRAFVDNEGKILVALDGSIDAKSIADRRKQREEINRKREKIKKYFSKDKIGVANSGVLTLLQILKNVASRSGVDFNLLLQLITENKLAEVGDDVAEANEFLDLIDDSLLALQAHQDDGTSTNWVDSFFRKSLAYIQVSKTNSISGDEVIAFMKARIEGIIARVGDDRGKWNSIIKAGLPLNSNLYIEDSLLVLLEFIRAYLLTEKNLGDKLVLLKNIESILHGLPLLNSKAQSLLKMESINEIREKWLSGDVISTILPLDGAQKVLSDLYNFSVPWAINGIAKKLRNQGSDEEAEVLEELSVLVETGLPNLTAVKVYHAGIRSRRASIEISQVFDAYSFEIPIQQIKNELVFQSSYYKERVSDYSREWIDLLIRASNRRLIAIRRIPDFTFGNTHETAKVLLPHIINGRVYLISPELTIKEDVTDSELEISKVAGIPGVSFVYNRKRKLWEMQNENPYMVIEGD